MAKEERTLEIVARVKDQITKTMKRMARTVKRLIKSGFLAPFKLLGRSIKAVSTSMIAFSPASVRSTAWRSRWATWTAWGSATSVP